MFTQNFRSLSKSLLNSFKTFCKFSREKEHLNVGTIGIFHYLTKDMLIMVKLH